MEELEKDVYEVEVQDEQLLQLESFQREELTLSTRSAPGLSPSVSLSLSLLSLSLRMSSGFFHFYSFRCVFGSVSLLVSPQCLCFSTPFYAVHPVSLCVVPSLPFGL